MPLDKTDGRLVSLLQADARLTYEELGKAVGLSAAAAYQRVRKLEEGGVLCGYHARVEPSLVGKPILALLYIQLGPATDRKQLLERWEGATEALECHAVAGDAGYLLKLRLPNLAALEPHVDTARRAGCTVRSHIVTATTFERWSIPVG